MGAPSTLTPDVRDSILRHLSTGITPEQAALASDVPASTFFSWTKRGRDEKQRRAEGAKARNVEAPYLELLERIEFSRARGQAFLAGQVTRAAGPRQVTTTKTRTVPLRTSAGAVKDASGNVIMVTETTVEIREEFDWRAAAWMLERLYPETWAAIQRTEVSGPDGGPVRVEQVRAQALALIDELRLRRASSPTSN